MTLVFHHAACARHDQGPHHPESPARVHGVLAALERNCPGADLRQAPAVEREQLLRIHPPDHVDRILDSIPSSGLHALDWDTTVGPDSGEAVLRAAGAACAGVDAVLRGDATDVFCAVRPPGHHAEPSSAMGFCLFNNVAVAAAHARVHHGLSRVAILDFDVHHGNGTQKAFWSEPEVLFASTHEMPLYPGTGTPLETGAGNILNVPLEAGTASEAFRAVWTEVLERVGGFGPELILVSAGFDGHRLDPLAHLELETADFAWLGERIAALARVCCERRVVSTLEGGYHLQALAESTVAYLNAYSAAPE